MAAPATTATFGAFDFGLSPEQEERALRLHEESMIIDLLYQGPCGWRTLTGERDALYQKAWDEAPTPEAALKAATSVALDLALAGKLPEFREHWEASGLTGGNRQFTLDPETMLWSFAYYTAMFDRFSWMQKALTAQDFHDAKASGRRAGYFTTQDTTGIPREVEILDLLYKLGARVIGLTYNYQNYVGSGCTDRADGGVSDFGARFVRRMNELGIIVDTAHSGRQTTLDACAISDKPVIASHTGAAGLRAHDRNKTDEELRAIAASGGVIGVYAVPFFLAAGDQVPVTAMLDHLEYIAGLAGWEHVAIGTDWPMQHGRASLARLNTLEEKIGFRPEHRIDWFAHLVGFEDYRDLPNLTRGLVARGCTDEQVRGVLGENFIRVFREVCG
jgi:membrane dipeptidase